ncbi:MAG: histidine kinase dimerization/phosphoacceptor domain-containing protein [Anaerolineae bacterium]|nr:histidine kinase dimerization/phosphoacceptor domain-containing protein [Anaerolineae bacterium]
MAESLTPEALRAEIEAHLSPEARRWLADLLHDHLGGRITNLSLQAEIVLRAWDAAPDMARSEMEELRERLKTASVFLVDLVRTVTPPADDAAE